MPATDRRREHRLLLQTGAKVYDYKTRRYRPARTVNISAGGALLELLGPANVVTGDRVDIALDPSGNHPVVRHGDMTPARVARTEGRTHLPVRIAVQFTYPLALPQAA